jgi:NAD(P)-dependent dehydrogenase (short-subunit alcohol dehydrogenase family)
MSPLYISRSLLQFRRSLLDHIKLLELAPHTMSSPSKALVWLITGCASGFGASLSIIALKAGHKVIATSRNPSKSPELVKQIEGLGGIWLQLDVNEETAHLQNVIELGTMRFGPIDVLVNNAGISLIGAVEDTR